MKTVHCGHATDKGRKRDHNEDSYIADPETGFFIIADGMGGYEAGEVASALVVESVCRDVSNGLPLDEAFGQAHSNVRKAAADGRGRSGMGAAAVALKIEGADFQVAWVGDSRAYLWDGCLTRLTRDHSFVQKMMDTGVLTEEEARMHPKRNVLTQALGAQDIAGPAVDVVFGSLYRGQKILLCSDGLTGALKDEEISVIMGQDLPPQECASALIRAANDHGAKDNVSVILVASMVERSGTADEDDTLPMEKSRVNQLSGKPVSS